MIKDTEATMHVDEAKLSWGDRLLIVEQGNQRAVIQLQGVDGPEQTLSFLVEIVKTMGV